MSGASEQPGLFDVATPETAPLREVLMTAGGHPRHPLYLPSATELVRW